MGLPLAAKGAKSSRPDPQRDVDTRLHAELEWKMHFPRQSKDRQGCSEKSPDLMLRMHQWHPRRPVRRQMPQDLRGSSPQYSQIKEWMKMMPQWHRKEAMHPEKYTLELQTDHGRINDGATPMRWTTSPRQEGSTAQGEILLSRWIRRPHQTSQRQK